MKRFLTPALCLFFFTIIISFNKAHGQNAAAKNTIPPFRILLTNMQYLKAAELDKNSAKLIVYFDPTCEHCKTFMTDLLKHENDLGKIQIIMISYTPIDQVKKFETELSLTKYSNMKIGTEGNTFIVRYFYNIQKFPFVALHDKKGIMVASYIEPTSANDVIEKIKKM
jgi:AhpC/TSA family